MQTWPALLLNCLFASLFDRSAMYLAWLHGEQADWQNFLYYSRDLQAGLCFYSEPWGQKRKNQAVSL